MLSPGLVLLLLLLKLAHCRSFSQSQLFAPNYDIQDLSNDATFLSRRDVCSDAFGSDASNAICAPSNTLCCVRSGQMYPSCQQYLDLGWCCVGDDIDSNCYVDIPSDCDAYNAVACSNLTEGTQRACCPRLTRCFPELEASEENVRCEIGYDDLTKLVSSAAESSTSVFPIPTTSTSSLTTTTSTKKPSTTPTSSGPAPTQQTESGISAGAISGIAIGSVAGLALVGAVSWYILRLRKRTRQAEDSAGISSTKPPGRPDFSYSGSYSGAMESFSARPMSELPSERSPQEASWQTPRELSPSQNHASQLEPQELYGSYR